MRSKKEKEEQEQKGRKQKDENEQGKRYVVSSACGPWLCLLSMPYQCRRLGRPRASEVVEEKPKGWASVVTVAEKFWPPNLPNGFYESPSTRPVSHFKGSIW